jgi:hypothetical protein
MSAVVCTLFEGDYHYGVGALANSLYRSGFRGEIVAGYRGALPVWAESAEKSNADSVLPFAPGGRIAFVPVDTKVHLTHYKAVFLQRVLGRSPEVGAVFYFDPDIVVRCRWAFFEEWVRGGIAVCADTNWNMPASHPTREAWRRALNPFGLTLERRLDLYLNAGYIGVPRAAAEFLPLWESVQGLVASLGGDDSVLALADRSLPFAVADQDALNAALSEWRGPISAVGPDGMDFRPSGGGYIMSHAIGVPKPWQTQMTWQALKGRRPTRASLAFLAHAQRPIALYPRWLLEIKKLDALAARAIGRVVA